MGSVNISWSYLRLQNLHNLRHDLFGSPKIIMVFGILKQLIVFAGKTGSQTAFDDHHRLWFAVKLSLNFHNQPDFAQHAGHPVTFRKLP